MKNLNPLPVTINTFECTIPQIKLYLESLTEANGALKYGRKVINRKGSKNRPILPLQPYEIAVFSLNINMAQEEILNGFLKFSTDTVSYRVKAYTI